GRTGDEVFRKATKADLAEALARLRACDADEELRALAEDCLAAEPEGRPHDAGVVADRVTAHLAGVAERLRKAELARVEAQARAAQARLPGVLATSAMAIVLLAVGGWSWIRHERDARRARSTALVASALAEASQRRGEAKAAPVGDLSAWDAAFAAAGRAEALVAGGDVEAATRGQVRAFLDDLRAER